MTVAILTRYLPATDYKGSRIKATARPGKGYSLTIPYDHALNISELYKRAASMLAERLQWSGTWVAGSIDAPVHGVAWVCIGQRASVPDVHADDTFTIARGK